jgi:peptidoglycan/LPS O-acetylase OafA/YrhL
MSQYNKSYLDQLTWLRGFAAFLVIISHCLRATEVTYKEGEQVSNVFPLSLVDLGSFGVVLFFTLSGCTLFISNANKVSGSNIATFYIKRFFRIWPAFFFSLIFYAIFSIIFVKTYGSARGVWIEPQFLTTFQISDFVSYLTLTFNIWGKEGLFNNAYWSLPVEFQYYLLFPVLIFLINRFGVLGPILCSAVIYMLPKLGVVSFNQNVFFTLVFSFTAGVLISYFYSKYEFKMPTTLGFFLIVLILGAAIAITQKFFQLPHSPILSDRWSWYMLFATFIVGIIIFMEINISSRLAAFLEWYGTISYSTYLYHNLFIAMAVLGLIHSGIEAGYLRFLVVFSFAAISSYWAAGLSYKYIEAPWIKRGSKYAKSIQQKT